jgi:hypothetical protein
MRSSPPIFYSSNLKTTNKFPGICISDYFLLLAMISLQYQGFSGKARKICKEPINLALRDFFWLFFPAYFVGGSIHNAHFHVNGCGKCMHTCYGIGLGYPAPSNRNPR